MFHNNPTKSDCSKKQTKKFKPFKGKINFFTERRSFHLNFFQTGNKNFSKNFFFFFLVQMYLHLLDHCQYLREPHTAASTPIPPSTFGGTSCLTPNLGVQSQHQPQPNPGNTDSYPSTDCSKPSSFPILCHFCPFPSF